MVLMLAIVTIAALMLLPGLASEETAGSPEATQAATQEAQAAETERLLTGGSLSPVVGTRQYTLPPEEQAARETAREEAREAEQAEFAAAEAAAQAARDAELTAATDDNVPSPNVESTGISAEGMTQEAAQEIRFQKQCFLSTNMLKIHQKVKALNNWDFPVKPVRYTAIRGAPASDITGELLARPEIQELLNEKPALMSFIMPTVRIYKVLPAASLSRDQRAQNAASMGMASRDAIAQATLAGSVAMPGSFGFANLIGGQATGVISGMVTAAATATPEVEFQFDDHTSEADIDSITQNHSGRAGGVGLESFEWDFLGVNPAEVENNIRAKISLRFNNMSDFDRVRTGGRAGTSYRFSDLVIPEPMRTVGMEQVYNPDHFRIKVVVGWTLASSAQRSHIDPETGASEGPETVSDRVDELLSPGVQYEMLKEMIEKNRKVMFLNLINHQIDFDETGAMSLSAEYQAYVEGAFSALGSDILNISQANNTSIVQRSLEDTQDDIGVIRQARSTGSGCTVSTGQAVVGDSEELEELHENAIETRQNLAATFGLLRRRDKNMAYQSILSRLTDGNMIYNIGVPMENILGGLERASRGFFEAGTDEEVFFNLGTAESVGRDLASRDLRSFAQAYSEDSAGLQQSIAQARAQNPHGRFNVTRRFAAERIGRGQGTGRALAGERRRSAGDIQRERERSGQAPVERRTTAAQGTTGTAVNVLRAHTTAATDSDIDLSGDTAPSFSDSAFEAAIESIKAEINVGLAGSEPIMNIEFVFFGDLIDIILAPHTYYGNSQSTGQWLTDNFIELCLGSFQYTDPGNTSSPPKNICLADIPISVELFGIWFLEAIVEPYRSRMTLRQFIRSVFDKLIINSFGTDCIYDDTGTVTLEQEDITVSPEFYTIGTQRMNDSGLRPPWPRNVVWEFTDTTNLLDFDPTLGFKDYSSMVLYQDRSDNHRGAKINEIDMSSGYVQQAERDMQNGVYHLNIGSDRGLVKSIKFNRMDQKYLPEARWEQSGDINHIAQLRERYNATVTMYGNVYFYPGQHVFLNPSVVGVSGVAGSDTLTVPTIEGLTTKLGIGGYFLITKVENVIESGLFETILHCNWVHTGFATGRKSGEDCQNLTLSREYGGEAPEADEPDFDRQRDLQGVR